MSLIEPNFFLRYKTWLIYGGLGILLIGVALFLYDCGENAWFKSKVQKQKDEIKAETNKIANISSQIIELEKEKAAATANVNAAAEQLQKDIFGREELKTEANQALANFQRAANSNLNVNRSAEDLEKILERLGKE